MTAPGNDPLILTLLAAFIVCTGYAGGRLHQWYRMGRDRDDAFRDGYDTATRSVFTLAARAISPRRADRSEIRAAAVDLPASAVTTRDEVSPAARIPANASIEPSGRHTVPDELVRAATYRLNADRVARAKVPGAVLPGTVLPGAVLPGVVLPGAVPSDDPAGAERTPLLSVPKPRSS